MLYEAMKSEIYIYILLEADYSVPTVTYSNLHIFLFSVLWRFFNKQTNIYNHFIISRIYDLIDAFFRKNIVETWSLNIIIIFNFQNNMFFISDFVFARESKTLN